MNPKMKVYGSALALFFAGAVAGGFGSELAAHGAPNPGERSGASQDEPPAGGRFEGEKGHRMHRGQMGKRIQERLTKKLNLSADQQEKVREILESAKADFQKLREQHQGERREHMQAVGDKIRTILNPDQQRDFDALRQKMRERMERFKKNGGGEEGGHGRRFHHRHDGDGENGPRGEKL